jgi:hypothetical protein
MYFVIRTKEVDVFVMPNSTTHLVKRTEPKNGSFLRLDQDWMSKVRQQTVLLRYESLPSMEVKPQATDLTNILLIALSFVGVELRKSFVSKIRNTRIVHILK